MGKRLITEDGQECSICHQFLPWANFTKDRNRRYGYLQRCKVCQKEKKKKRRPFLILENGRQCTICSIFKSWDNFSFGGNSSTGRHSQCKECRRKLRISHPRNPVTFYNESGQECITCKQFKPWNEFSRCKQTTTGHFSRCRECEKARIYGLTMEELQELRRRNNNRCDICGKKERKALGIDHDHTTGKVRGLLCDRCNFLLGLSGDSIEILTSAIRYLTRYLEEDKE